VIITTELNWWVTNLGFATLTSTLALMGPSWSKADDGVSYLPPLGNTEQADHALSREVDDEHVFTGDTAILPPTRVQAAVKDDSADTGSVIWDSIRQGEGLGFNSSELIELYKQQYLEQFLFTNQILERSRLYIAYFVKALDDRYLPVELALLPAIESGFRPHAQSKKDAVGLWQIVPITALEIGITRSRWFDGRADLISSTTAAIDYLSYLNAEFDGDWELALAAYNAGPGRVRAAIASNQKAGKGVSFKELNLPEETKNYVPKFAALLELVKDPQHSQLQFPIVKTEDAFEVIDVGTRISLDRLAELSSINEATLKSLNSGLTLGVTPPEGPHTIYLLRGQANKVKEVVAATKPAQLFLEPKIHTVVAGETLGGIALRYGMPIQELKSLNRLNSELIRIGQKLSVIDSEFSDQHKLLQYELAPGDTLSEIKQAKSEIKQPKLVQYKVASGDTLSEIAEQFSVNVSEIVSAAGKPLASDVIRPGDTLQIPTTSANGS